MNIYDTLSCTFWLSFATAQLQGGRKRQEDAFITRRTPLGLIAMVADAGGYTALNYFSVSAIPHRPHAVDRQLVRSIFSARPTEPLAATGAGGVARHSQADKFAEHLIVNFLKRNESLPVSTIWL